MTLLVEPKSLQVVYGTSIHCDCCGRQKMLEIDRSGLETLQSHHGRWHRLVLTPRELLEKLSGTVDGSAVTFYVRQIMMDSNGNTKA